MTAVERALKTHFGFEKFRSQQQESVVKAVLKGKPLGTGIVFRITLVWDVVELASWFVLSPHHHLPAAFLSGLLNSLLNDFKVCIIAVEGDGLWFNPGLT